MRDEQVAQCADLPGAVVHARAFTSDDPVTLGWALLRNAMTAEGTASLRGVDDATIAVGRKELAEFNPTVHHWDLFMADATTLRDVCGTIVADGLPDRLTRISDADLTPERVHEVQAFLTDQGVMPFSADALTGKLFPARLLALQHRDGRIAAADFSAMTHNRHSPFAGVAWVGLIAVDPEFRGHGLGKKVDAICNLMAVDELGATATMEFVAKDNVPSRAMLESCGLRQIEGKSVVVFSTSDKRLTR